jgi:hypothetical protein
MSSQGISRMGNEERPNILPIKKAEGPGYLGPDYNPADELLAPAQIGVRRGDSLGSVLDAAKGVVYYSDMIGFGEPSSSFTQGMPGLRPLGVNYFMKTGATCSNGAEMWEYVETIPNGSALGDKVKGAIRDMGLPQLRGMGPGILEDAKSALNPMPVIGSGLPRCRLMKLPVGDIDGKINNADGQLIVDPDGLLYNTRDNKFYQEKWIQDREVPPVRRAGETDLDQFMRGKPIQLDYDTWNNEPKVYGEDGCKLDKSSGGNQPAFCGKQSSMTTVTLPDKTTVKALNIEGFQSEGPPVSKMPMTNEKHVKLAVCCVAVLGLCAFWSGSKVK